MTNKRRLMTFSMLWCFLCQIILSGCGQTQKEAPVVMEVAKDALEEDQTVEVCRGTWENCTYLQGYVAPKIHQLSFAREGNFQEYLVALGDEVSKGQLLATLSDEECQKTIKELEQQLTDKKAEYEFQVAYIDKTIEAYDKEMDGYYAMLEDEENPLEEWEYTETCYELGIRDVAQKREELKKTHLTQTYTLESSHIQKLLSEEKEKLEDLKLYAPCDGTVVALYQFMNTLDTVPEKDYVAIAEKDIYYLRCEYLTDSYLNSVMELCGIHNGKEYEIVNVAQDPKVYREMKNCGDDIFTHFEITEPDENIAYGDLMTVKLTMERKENVLFIPKLAVVSDITGKYVFLQTPEGKEKVYPSFGAENKLNRIVKDGLEEGDVVYVQN